MGKGGDFLKKQGFRLEALRTPLYSSAEIWYF